MRGAPRSPSETTSSRPADTISGSPPAVRPACRATPRDEAFVGREHELGVLDTLLAQVCTDGARIALVRGAPGVGKTALVRRFLDDHPHLTAVRGSGDEGEATISYALVDQLFGAVGLGGGALLAHIERVLPVEEPIVVGRLILAALIRSSVAGPVVVVVDDAHWADVDSLRALLFAARRLATHPVLTILVVPPDEARLPAGLGRLAEGHTGTTLEVGPLTPAGVQALAATATGSPVTGLVAHRLCAHTLGNPRHLLALLMETPADRWQGWEPVLPAPRVFSRMIGRRLAACSDRARRFVEAAAVVGDGATLATSAVLADVDGPLGEVEEACAAGLLDASACATLGSLAFADPLVRAAVYGQLTPVRRLRLHREAALLVDDERAALHHRAAAAQHPDDTLADELQRFSDRSRTSGQWREAAWALLESGRLSGHRKQREQRLLRAVGLLGDAGAATGAATLDLGPPAAHGPKHDVTNGYIALVQGRAAEAHASLHAAWSGRDQAGPEVAALIAQRLALHGAGRLQGVEVVEWARQALELAGPEDPVRVEALALLGLGLGWVGWPPVPHRAPTVDDALVARGGATLGLDVDEVAARAAVACAAREPTRAGSVWFAVWSYVWSVRASVAVGAWDEAVADAERAVSLVTESGHDWLRPLARCAAAAVPAARGEWAAAEEHAAAAEAGSSEYELMVASARTARALVPAARGDHVGVLRAMGPVAALVEQAGVDESGFWPWQDVFADALVSAGRLEEAEVFLAPHEEFAATRGRWSTVARLARVRGRLEAARGRLPEAEAAFGRAAESLEGLVAPFDRALLDLAHGQVLRRAGQRRAAAKRLAAARERFATLRARPYMERCEQESAACGLAPAKRSGVDPSRLTAQELAVARLVAAGLSNRHVASELFISIKTVQFHLTHVYAKSGVSSRAELASQFRDEPTTDPGESPTGH
jgi:DNA-binding CsgD family transcriptional regulator